MRRGKPPVGPSHAAPWLAPFTRMVHDARPTGLRSWPFHDEVALVALHGCWLDFSAGDELQLARLHTMIRRTG